MGSMIPASIIVCICCVFPAVILEMVQQTSWNKNTYSIHQVSDYSFEMKRSFGCYMQITVKLEQKITLIM